MDGYVNISLKRVVSKVTIVLKFYSYRIHLAFFVDRSCVKGIVPFRQD